MLDLTRWTDGWGDTDVGAIIDVCQMMLHIIAGATMGCHCLAMFGNADCILRRQVLSIQ